MKTNDTPLPPSAQKVQQALQARGYPNRVVQVTQSARTAAEAAQALGCDVGQIAKSLVFRTRKSKRPVLVIASGAHRVDEKKLRALVGEKSAKRMPISCVGSPATPSVGCLPWGTRSRSSPSSTAHCWDTRPCGRPRAPRTACSG